MKPTIEELMLQIISTAAIVSLQGKWHAFAFFHGKCGSLDVNVKSAEPGEEASHSGAYFAHPDGWGGFTPEQSTEHCLQTLSDQLAWIQGYLELSEAPALEAAA